MPIYAYKCNACDMIADLLVTYSESSDDKPQLCENCGALQMYKQDTVNAINFNLKGKWYKTTKSY